MLTQVSYGKLIRSQGSKEHCLYKVEEGFVLEYINGKCFKVTKPGEYLLVSDDGMNITEARTISDCSIEVYDKNEQYVPDIEYMDILHNQFKYTMELATMRSLCGIAKTAYIMLATDGITISRKDQSEIINLAQETLIKFVSDLENCGHIEKCFDLGLKRKGNRKRIEVINKSILNRMINNNCWV